MGLNLSTCFCPSHPKQKDTASQQDLRKIKQVKEEQELADRPAAAAAGKGESDQDATTVTDGQNELEKVLKIRIETLARERQDLTVNLVNLDLEPSASEDENYSTDGLDLSSCDELESVSFDGHPSPSKLTHLNKNRAPKQEKRKPRKGHKTPGSDGLTQTPPPVSKKHKKSIRKGSKKEKKQREGSKERRKRADSADGVVML